MVNDKLGRFLADAAGKPERMGHWDCGLWLADWYMAATGRPDPAAHMRGASYSGAEIARHVRAIVRSLGLRRTRTPQSGSVGLVSFKKGHLVGAIFSGTHWCVLTDPQGISAVPPHLCRFVAAWRIE